MTRACSPWVADAAMAPPLSCITAAPQDSRLETEKTSRWLNACVCQPDRTCRIVASGTRVHIYLAGVRCEYRSLEEASSKVLNTVPLRPECTACCRSHLPRRHPPKRSASRLFTLLRSPLLDPYFLTHPCVCSEANATMQARILLLSAVCLALLVSAAAQQFNTTSSFAPRSAGAPTGARPALAEGAPLNGCSTESSKFKLYCGTLHRRLQH